MNKLSQRELDLKLRMEFQIELGAHSVCVGTRGVILDLGELTFDQAWEILKAAQHAGVNLNRRRTR